MAFAVVATASLVTLPVTWFHYPVALLPIAVLLAVAHPPARPILTAAAVIAAIAIAWLPLTWLAVALLLAAWRAGVVAIGIVVETRVGDRMTGLRIVRPSTETLLKRYAGRPALVAIAAMNVITGLAAAAILAPLSAGADVETYRRGAEGIQHGQYVYGFLYTPLAGLLATPLTWVPEPVAAILMSAIGAIVLLVGVRLETAGMAALDRVLVAIGVVFFLPIVNELLLGQVTLLLAATLYPVRGRDGIARGIPLGVMVALVPKPLLLPVLLWMLIRRPWALVGAVVSAAAADVDRADADEPGPVR